MIQFPIAKYRGKMDLNDTNSNFSLSNGSSFLLDSVVYPNVIDFHNGTVLPTTVLPVTPKLNPYPQYLPYNVDQIRASYWIIKIVYPFLLLLCTVGNVLTLVVLSRTKHKGSTNGYMCTIAGANLVILWMYLPQFLHTCGLKDVPGYLVPFYYFWGVQQYLTDVFINLSDWVLIVFSLERLLAVTFPLTFRKYQSVKYARILSGLLLIVALIASFYLIFDYYYEYNPQNRLKMIGYERITSPAYDTWGVVQKEWEVIDGIGKFFLLLIINIIVMVVIKRMQSFNGRKSGNQKRAKAQQRNSTLLLMGSVTLYLVTQTLQVVMNILYLTYYENIELKPYYTKMARPGDYHMAQPYSKVIQYLNYSVNFFIYVVVSDMFRKQFLDIFGDYKIVRWLRVKRKQWNGKGPATVKGGRLNLSRKPDDRTRTDSVFSTVSEISGVEMESCPPSTTLKRKVLAKPAAGLQAGMAKLAEFSKKSATIGAHAGESNETLPEEFVQSRSNSESAPETTVQIVPEEPSNVDNVGEPGVQPLPDIVITSVDHSVSSGPDSEGEFVAGRPEGTPPFRIRGSLPETSRRSSGTSGESGTPAMQSVRLTPQEPAGEFSDVKHKALTAAGNETLSSKDVAKEVRRGSEPAVLASGAEFALQNDHRSRGYFDSINRRRFSGGLELKRPVSPVLPGEAVTQL